MAKRISPEVKNAIVEGLKVFGWAGLSAILPLLVAYMEQDVRWAFLAPVINAIAFSIKTEYRNRSK